MRTLLFLLCLLCTGCYDSSFDESGTSPISWAATTTLAELHALYRGERVTIERDWVVAGRITAHDQGGNFYRSLIIEEEGAAIELMAGVDALHNDFPLGSKVMVALNGLTVARQWGILQVGLLPTVKQGYPVDYIGSEAALDRVLVRVAEALQPLEPFPVTLDALTPAMAGRLIRLERMQHTPETLEETIWSGYHRFTDEAGEEIYTYVRAYADFAEEQIPDGRCVLIGILQHDATGEGRYLLKLRDERDCQ